MGLAMLGAIRQFFILKLLWVLLASIFATVFVIDEPKPEFEKATLVFRGKTYQPVVNDRLEQPSVQVKTITKTLTITEN